MSHSTRSTTSRHQPKDERRVERLEDDRFIRGRGAYVDDLALPGMLHGIVIRSSTAHAIVHAVDVEAAKAAPGVLLVLRAVDLAENGLSTVPLDLPPPGGDVGQLRHMEQPVLASGELRYVGEPLAFVVADSADAARDAAELVTLDCEDLPAVVDIASATRDDVLAWSGSATNVVFEYDEGDAAAVDRLFGSAHEIVELEVLNSRVHALPLEPRGCIGMFDAASRQFTLHASTQRVHILQRALADRVFRVPRERMRVIAPDTGGGFGQKNGLYPEYVLCLEAARRLGKPVKWISDRSESFASDNHGRDNLFLAEAALSADGTITAIRATRMMNLGAYLSPRSMVPVPNGITHLTGVYGIQAAHVTVKGLLTNTACTSPYRGAGRPENVFCCERLIDRIARTKGCDPIDLRRRNLVRAEAMPWKSPLGTLFDKVDPALMLEKALVGLNHHVFRQRKAEAEQRGRLRGLGVALFAEDLHGSGEPVTVRIAHEAGMLKVLTGTGSAGHGHETSFLQIAADRLRLPLERLSFVQSDTAQIPDGIGTAASWSITLGGSSVHLAAEAAIAEARRIAAGLLRVPPDAVNFDEGSFRTPASNVVVGWDDIFHADPSFSVAAAYTGTGETVSIGCHACEVEVDPETGGVEIVGYSVAQDCGTVINPMLVEGQLHGGVAQGVGQGWCEAIQYDPESGQLSSGSLTDYALPRALDLPQIKVWLHDEHFDGNPLGVKGIGESAATGSTPAFVNAVLDALAASGIPEIPMPLSPLSIWNHLRMQRTS